MTGVLLWAAGFNLVCLLALAVLLLWSERKRLEDQ